MGGDDETEHHRVQGMAGGEAEAVERRGQAADGRAGLVGTRSFGRALQPLVDQRAGESRHDHVQHARQRRPAMPGEQRQHQRVPEYPVAETAGEPQQGDLPAGQAHAVEALQPGVFAGGQPIKAMMGNQTQADERHQVSFNRKRRRTPPRAACRRPRPAAARAAPACARSCR